MDFTKGDRDMVVTSLRGTAIDFDTLAEVARSLGQTAVELGYSDRAKRALQLARWFSTFQENSDAD